MIVVVRCLEVTGFNPVFNLRFITLIISYMYIYNRISKRIVGTAVGPLHV